MGLIPNEGSPPPPFLNSLAAALKEDAETILIELQSREAAVIY